MILGYDKKTVGEADEMLQQLADNGFIIRYEVDGTAYIQVTNFWKHQNPNKKEKASEIPPPEGYRAGTYRAQDKSESEQQGAEDEFEEPSVDTSDEDQEESQTANSKRSAAIALNKVKKERFAEFYKAYPKKVKRKKAEEIWMRLKLDDLLFRQIMDGLQRSKDSDNWHRGFIPDPTTWLNGEQWNDEPAPWKGEEADKNGYRNSGNRTSVASTAEPGGESTGTPAGFKGAYGSGE